MQDSEIIRLLSEATLKSHEAHWALISRGQNKEPWTGEGLPPVGTVCEVLNNEVSGPEWERCTILYSGKFRIMYDSESCYERVGFIDNLKFRQIRRPDQIAAEKREADIEELRMLLSKVACDDYHAAVAMIDAGYRKQDNADERK